MIGVMELKNQHLTIIRVLTGLKQKSSMGIKTNRGKYDDKQEPEALPKTCINDKGTESNSTVETCAESSEHLKNVNSTRNRQTEATRSRAETLRRTRPLPD